MPSVLRAEGMIGQSYENGCRIGEGKSEGESECEGERELGMSLRARPPCWLVVRSASLAERRYREVCEEASLEPAARYGLYYDAAYYP